MFQVCDKLMSGNRREIVRLDFERDVTRRYERREIAAAMAACYRVLEMCMFAGVMWTLPFRVPRRVLQTQ